MVIQALPSSLVSPMSSEAFSETMVTPEMLPKDMSITT